MNIIIQNQAESANPSFYCIKDEKTPGFAAKKKWFSQENNQNLQLLTAVDDQGKALGFIEYTTAENAWRPVIAPDYLFIHCIAVISKENRNQSVGSSLIQACLEEAKSSPSLLSGLGFEIKRIRRLASALFRSMSLACQVGF